MDSVISTRLEPFQLDGSTEYHSPFILAIGTLYSTEDWLYYHHDDCKEGYAIKMAALNEEDESIWPEVWTTKALKTKRKKMSTANWQAMYCADPLIRGGNLFKLDWLESYELTDPAMIEYRGLFIDPAISEKSTADHTTVCLATRLRDGRVYIEKIWYYHKSAFDSIQFIQRLYQKWSPRLVVIETVGAFDSIREGLVLANVPATKWTPGRRDKTTRIIDSLEANIESGILIFHPDVIKDEQFQNEYTRFPSAKHDDVLDAIAIAAEKLIAGANPFTETNQYYDFSTRALHGEARERARRQMNQTQEQITQYNPYSSGKSRG